MKVARLGTTARANYWAVIHRDVIKVRRSVSPSAPTATRSACLDEAMTAAVRAEDVLCGDETPTNVISSDIDETTEQPVAGSPHAVTLRTPDRC